MQRSRRWFVAALFLPLIPRYFQRRIRWVPAPPGAREHPPLVMLDIVRSCEYKGKPEIDVESFYRAARLYRFTS